MKEKATQEVELEEQCNAWQGEFWSLWADSSSDFIAKLQNSIYSSFRILRHKNETKYVIDDFKMYCWDSMFYALVLRLKGHRDAHLGPTQQTIDDAYTGIIYGANFSRMSLNMSNSEQKPFLVVT